MTAMTATARTARPTRRLKGDLRLAAHQLLDDQRTFWRNRSRAFFSFALPLMFLVIFAALNQGDTLEDRGNIPADAYIIPGVLAYGVIMATFSNIAADIAIARESGVLKRTRGTPMPAWAFLAGRIGSAVVVALSVTGVTLVLADVVYDVRPVASATPGLVLALVAGTACFAALGIAVVRLIDKADSATAVTSGLILPLTFISGVWGDFGDLPTVLDRIAAVFPIQHLAHALQVTFDPRTTGAGIDGVDLLVLGIWLVAGVHLAFRFLAAELRRA
jgi:ABC-2 type transport system permease protein